MEFLKNLLLFITWQKIFGKIVFLELGLESSKNRQPKPKFDQQKTVFEKKIPLFIFRN